MTQLSASELIAQRASLDREIAALEAAARTDAIGQVKTLMARFGLTVADLGGYAQDPAKTGRRPVKHVAPKYRNPATGAVWSGRGRPARWLAEAVAAGASLDEFLVRTRTFDTSTKQSTKD